MRAPVNPLHTTRDGVKITPGLRVHTEHGWGTVTPGQFSRVMPLAEPGGPYFNGRFEVRLDHRIGLFRRHRMCLGVDMTTTETTHEQVNQ
jgi:hypothetical protein